MTVTLKSDEGQKVMGQNARHIWGKVLNGNQGVEKRLIFFIRDEILCYLSSEESEIYYSFSYVRVEMSNNFFSFGMCFFFESQQLQGIGRMADIFLNRFSFEKPA